MGRHVTRLEEMRSGHRILVGKPGGKRPLERLVIDGILEK
jgi:hypothetical protein